MADKDHSATPLGKKPGAKPGVEVLVLFTTSRAELERRFRALKKTVAPADGLSPRSASSEACLPKQRSSVDGDW